MKKIVGYLVITTVILLATLVVSEQAKAEDRLDQFKGFLLQNRYTNNWTTTSECPGGCWTDQTTYSFFTYADPSALSIPLGVGGNSRWQRGSTNGPAYVKRYGITGCETVSEYYGSAGYGTDTVTCGGENGTSSTRPLTSHQSPEKTRPNYKGSDTFTDSDPVTGITTTYRVDDTSKTLLKNEVGFFDERFKVTLIADIYPVKLQKTEIGVYPVISGRAVNCDNITVHGQKSVGSAGEGYCEFTIVVHGLATRDVTPSTSSSAQRYYFYSVRIKSVEKVDPSTPVTPLPTDPSATPSPTPSTSPDKSSDTRASKPSIFSRLINTLFPPKSDVIVDVKDDNKKKIKAIPRVSVTNISQEKVSNVKGNGGLVKVEYIKYSFTLKNLNEYPVYLSKIAREVLDVAASSKASINGVVLEVSGTNKNDSAAAYSVAPGTSRDFSYEFVMDYGNGSATKNNLIVNKIKYGVDTANLASSFVTPIPGKTSVSTSVSTATSASNLFSTTTPTTGVFITNKSATATVVDNGSNPPVSAVITFNFTVNNASTTGDIYISKNTSRALATTSTIGRAASSTLIQALTIVSPAVRTGDTIGSYVIPMGTSRTFSYIGILNNTNSDGRFHSTSIKYINYGFSDFYHNNYSVTSDLNELITPAVFIGNSWQSATTTTPTIKLISPNGGERILYTDIVTTGKLEFMWKTSQGSAYRPSPTSSVSLITEIGSIIRENPLNLPRTVTIGGGIYVSTFISEEGIVPDRKYKIKVCDTISDYWVCDQSDNYFTIVSSATIPTTGVSITNKSATATLVDNGTNRPVSAVITFNFTVNNASTTADIYISKDPNRALSTTSTAVSTLTRALTTVSPAVRTGDTNNAYVVPMGTSRTFSYFGLLNNRNSITALQSTSINAIYFGPGDFYIQKYSVTSDLDGLRTPPVALEYDGGLATTTIPTITLLSPNGGEVIRQDEGMEIKWKSDGIGSFSSIRIDLVNSQGTFVRAIAFNIQNTGSYTWNIPSVVPGGRYKVAVSVIQGSYSDRSNNYFTIVSSTTPPVPTIFPTPSVTPSITARAYLLDTFIDKAGAWDNFSSGNGYGNKNNYDWNFKLEINTDTPKTIKSITLKHLNGYEGWSTASQDVYGKKPYPLVVYQNNIRLTNNYDQSIFMNSKAVTYDLYAQVESEVFRGADIIIVFSDGSTRSVRIGSSSLKPALTTVAPVLPTVSPSVTPSTSPTPTSSTYSTPSPSVTPYYYTPSPSPTTTSSPTPTSTVSPTSSTVESTPTPTTPTPTTTSTPAPTTTTSSTPTPTPSPSSSSSSSPSPSSSPVSRSRNTNLIASVFYSIGDFLDSFSRK